MYCINCGVKLADTERQCPLCGTVPFHPDIPMVETEPLYPENRQPVTQISPLAALIVTTTAFLVALLVTLLCDLRICGGITWSGYVIGALFTAYEIFILPFWFKKPNPVIFVPCAFAMIGLYLSYINFATEGDWFLSFALPIVGFTGLTVTAVVTLMRYVRRGRLYIFGGAAIATGLFAPVMEFLLNLTFGFTHGLVGSFYPLTALVLIGGMLIFLAICRPARESMERRFFI